MSLRYIALIILCILAAFLVKAEVAEARWFGLIKEVEANVKEEVKKVEVEFVRISYALGEEVPQEVIDDLIELYTTPNDTYLGYNKRYAMRRVIYCESWNRNIQSLVMKRGVQEDSWGVAQIHLPSHPNITKEQALDIDFSIKFMADNLGKVAWYGWDSSLDVCN